MFILDLLLNSRESRPVLASKILGCFFLMLAGIISMFFLFQALVPAIGYLESGAVVCGVLAILGSGLLFIERKKKPSHPEEAVQKALTFFKDLNIERTLKDNAPALCLLSLATGFVLSQVKNGKFVSDIYRIMK